MTRPLPNSLACSNAPGKSSSYPPIGHWNEQLSCFGRHLQLMTQGTAKIFSYCLFPPCSWLNPIFAIRIASHPVAIFSADRHKCDPASLFFSASPPDTGRYLPLALSLTCPRAVGGNLREPSILAPADWESYAVVRRWPSAPSSCQPSSVIIHI